jgi:hypothetical protein
MQEFVQEVGAKPVYGKSSVFSAKFYVLSLKVPQGTSGTAEWPLPLVLLMVSKPDF